MKTTRLTIDNPGDRKKGKCWAKHVTAVDKSRDNGYSLDGDFLQFGKEYDLPEGAVIVRNSFQGSWKNGNQVGEVLRVANGELVEVWSGDYGKEFLTLRDTAAELLHPVDAARLEQSWTSQLVVDGQPCSLYDFLDANWGADVTRLSEADVRSLFALEIGQELTLNFGAGGTTAIKRVG